MIERLLQVWSATETPITCQCGQALAIQIGHYEPAGEQLATLEVIVRCPGCWKQVIKRFTLTMEVVNARMHWNSVE